MESKETPASSVASPVKSVSEQLTPQVTRDLADVSSPQKRQKRSSSTGQPGEVQLSKKGRACIACRKLKVKCDSAERGSAGCSRCQRLSLECVNARKLRISLDAENDEAHPSIVRLDKAVEDILSRLKMSPLDTYGSKPIVTEQSQPSRSMSEFQTTRENSREPPEGEQDIAPAPMGSLYEVTQLNSLRSRLRRANPAKRSSRRNMEADLVSQKLLSLEDAQELFDLYKTSLARYLFATTMAEDTSLQTVRESSTLLFTAVMLVSALHIPGKESIHKTCHKQFLELIAHSMFEHTHTLDDIRALCIAAFWQPDLSWKLSGLCVRMATELNLHQAFYSAFYSQHITEEQRRRALEKARVWYLLYVLDHHFSIAYGRPPVTAELLPIKEYDVFINSPWCMPSDRRLLSQVSLFVTLSKAYEIFGLEPERLMGGDDASLLMHLRFTKDIEDWRERWKTLVMPDKYVADYPSKGVYLHHHFSLLVLNSLALRGRPLDSSLSTTLPTSLRPIALRAIESAHAILTFFLDEPSYRDSLVGVPLYLHSMIAFAVVFLMKMSHRWHAIGVSVDPESVTRPLIERIIEVLKKCQAGSGHMVYSMATGFERMLKNNWGKSDPSIDRLTNARRDRSKRTYTDMQTQHEDYASRLGNTPNSTSNHNMKTSIDSNLTSPGMYQHLGLASGLPNQAFDSPNNPDGISYFGDFQMASNVGGGMGGYGGYSLGLGSHDDMLWSAGMGYDLLHTNSRHDSFTDYGVGAVFPDSGYQNR